MGQRRGPVKYFRCIFSALALGSAGMMATMYWGFPVLRRCIAFSDETVIASAETGTVFLVIPAFICLIAVLGVSVAGLCAGFPLAKGDEDEKKEQKVFRRFVWVTLAFVALSGFSLCSRVCLHEDGGLSVYNAFNRQTLHHEAEDVRTVVMGTCKVAVSRYGSEGSIWLELLYPHSVDSYSFDLEQFRDLETRLSRLEALRKVYAADKVRIDNRASMDDVAEDRDFSEADRALAERILEY